MLQATNSAARARLKSGWICVEDVMQEHKPGSKPIDPDSEIENLKKRDMPGNPFGPDSPQKPENAPADEQP